MIANAVSGLGATAQKIAGDIRHLANWKEIEEPFESTQIGSSAMVRRLAAGNPSPVNVPKMLTSDTMVGLQKEPCKHSCPPCLMTSILTLSTQMRSERIYSLARELLSKPLNFANTLSDQWMERTLDDSAIRRIDIPEMFLLADAILLSLDNVTDGLVVYPQRIQSRVQEELPFMITESVCGLFGLITFFCHTSVFADPSAICRSS